MNTDDIREPNVFIVIRFLGLLAYVTFDTRTCRTDTRAHVVPTGDQIVYHRE